MKHFLKPLSAIFLPAVFTLLFAAGLGFADIPTPEGSDPISLGLMHGFPVPPDKQVTAENFGTFPYSRWSFHHMRELMPTRNIWRGDGAVSVLEKAHEDMGAIEFNDGKGRLTTVDEWQKNTFTDAMLVLYQGKVAYERYYHTMKPEFCHQMFSVTKSFTGLLLTQLIHEGKIDPKARVTAYIPELADSAWGDATVQQTLDMTTGIAFTEIYSGPASDIFKYAYAAGMAMPPEDYSGPMAMTDYLKTLKKEGRHGDGFMYQTVNSEVLGWIIRRVTGKHFAELMSERIWRPMGAEEDAYVLLDKKGAELMGAGLNATLRDLGRVCEMLRLGGVYNGHRIVSEEVIAEIRKGGDREKFKKGKNARKGYSYHNQWWITHNADGAYEAWGICGQSLHINPEKEVVIVKLSSHPVASNSKRHDLNANAFKAITEALQETPK